jgi:hypothetical protein
MQICSTVCKFKRRRAENFGREVKENKIEMNTEREATNKLKTT